MRAIKRAGFIPKYSMGHNPHPILKMSPPIPLGVASEAEYFSVAIEHENAAGFMDSLNLFLPTGVQCINSWKTERMPRITRYATATTYVVESIYSSDGDIIAEFLQEPRKYSFKDNIVNNSFIRELGKSSLICTLPTGHQNVRIDKFIESMNAILNTKLSISNAKKLSLLLSVEKIIDTDVYLSEMQNGDRYN